MRNLKFYYFNNDILLFFYYNAYQISLQNNEIISIFELKSKNSFINHYYFREEINIDEENYTNIKQYALNNNVKNADLKTINIKEYILKTYLDIYKGQEFIGFGEKYIFKKIDNEEITLNDYEESRIIKITKLCITLDNNNKININNNIHFNSIVNSSIYKILFPNNIKY